MISIEKQIELLAELSINWQYVLEQDENWKEFFKQHDLAIPFATLRQLKLVNYSENTDRFTEMQTMVRKAFYRLCEVLNIERDSKHLSIPDMFRRSPNPNIPLFDEETQREIERL
jgi:hypothetical protein